MQTDRVITGTLSEQRESRSESAGVTEQQVGPEKKNPTEIPIILPYLGYCYLVWRRRPFSFFYLWAGKEKWSGVSSTMDLCTPARTAIAVRPIRLLRIVMCNKVFRARHTHLYSGQC